MCRITHCVYCVKLHIPCGILHCVNYTLSVKLHTVYQTMKHRMNQSKDRPYLCRMYHVLQPNVVPIPNMTTEKFYKWDILASVMNTNAWSKDEPNPTKQQVKRGQIQRGHQPEESVGTTRIVIGGQSLWRALCTSHLSASPRLLLPMYNSVFNRLLCTQDRGLVPEAGGGAGFERAGQARDPGVT